jgi:hypothetical protein
MAEQPQFLIRVPKELRQIGVLTEPIISIKQWSSKNEEI